MAAKYLAGNRIIGTQGERMVATTHTAGSTTGSRQFIQSSNWGGNVYNHADYQGIIITKAQFYIYFLNT